MSKKTIKTFTYDRPIKVSNNDGYPNIYRAVRVRFDSEWQEYTVQDINDNNGAAMLEGTYFTSDLDDALATARRMFSEIQQIGVAI